ncbi:hypothetical protein [Kaistia terrae]|uniref:Uncharacterized protein n=1 Tax=Kaistia terrae TaxID=537017 RepID=A0ABW0Q0Q5_9HYPH|nr:hypothetical protein [Kaistia terrae]MCX5578855.1 hypothetical protein [Kaistia terrae]
MVGLPVGTPEHFRATLSDAKPPSGLGAPLAALWHIEKGDWDAAHALVQDDDSRAGAWVHAHIHRMEGDLWNARYWYGRAGQTTAEGDLAAEREGILTALLRA